MCYPLYDPPASLPAFWCLFSISLLAIRLFWRVCSQFITELDKLWRAGKHKAAWKIFQEIYRASDRPVSSRLNYVAKSVIRTWPIIYFIKSPTGEVKSTNHFTTDICNNLPTNDGDFHSGRVKVFLEPGHTGLNVIYINTWISEPNIEVFFARHWTSKVISGTEWNICFT